MAEYIDRQAAIEKIRYQGIYGSGYSNEEREDDVVDMIESIPAADVRPVVLCQDCIYAPTGNQDGADLEWPCDDFPERNPCPLKCEDRWYSRKPAPDFFCASGEKKEKS